MPYVKPKRYKIECFNCNGKGFTWRVEPPPNMRCPNCGIEGQMIINDEMGESRKCANCGYETDTYEVMKQYEKFHKGVK
jgi:DnaJ-class molecular chaperone